MSEYQLVSEQNNLSETEQVLSRRIQILFFALAIGMQDAQTAKTESEQFPTLLLKARDKRFLTHSKHL